MAMKDWSTTAADNDTAGSISWAEGMAPSTVNNSARQLMADVRSWVDDGGWHNWGHTTAYGSATTFTIASTDVTSIYTVGRRVRAVGSSTGTIYGRISASAFATNTTVTVVWDSGSLSNETLAISVSYIDITGDPIPAGAIEAASATLAGVSELATTTETLTGTDAARAVTPDALAALWEKGSDAASATVVSLGEGGFFHVTGTTTITDIDFGTDKSGRAAVLVFDGALTLTHNSTTLILPGGASITTATGDCCLVVSENGTDNVRVPWYQKASGRAVIETSYTPEWTYTAQTATTSGTTVELTTAIPDTALEIEVIISGVSMASASAYCSVQLGDAGGYETTNYLGVAHSFSGAAVGSTAAITSGIPLGSSSWDNGNTHSGVLRLFRWDDAEHQWHASGSVADSTATYQTLTSGLKTTSQALTSIRLASSSGNFDAGEARVRYR
jgi:hypothetical protein